MASLAILSSPPSKDKKDHTKTFKGFNKFYCYWLAHERTFHVICQTFVGFACRCAGREDIHAARNPEVAQVSVESDHVGNQENHLW